MVHAGDGRSRSRSSSIHSWTRVSLYCECAHSSLKSPRLRRPLSFRNATEFFFAPRKATIARCSMANSLNLKNASYIILILSFLIGIFWVTVLSQIGILSFVDTFSSLFGPLFGVMIADYYLIKSQFISNKDIYSTEDKGIYYFSNGWHIKGLYSLLVGFIFSASTIWNSNLMFLQSFAWIIGAIISLIIYYLLTKK